MLEPDLQASSEADWLQEFTMVQTDAGGTCAFAPRASVPGRLPPA